MTIFNLTIAGLLAISNYTYTPVVAGDTTNFSKSANMETATVSGATKPEAINLARVKALIHYPDIARDKGIEGELPVRVLINTKGRIVSHQYISDNAVYFKEAVDPHLRKIKFKSATYHGKPMNAWVTIWFDFKLMN